MIYLAGPYSHEDEEVREARFRALTAKAAELMLDGHVVFSPITHGHTIAEYHDLPKTWEWWSKQDFKFLRHCSKIMILRLDGYYDSVGVTAEIEAANMFNIPMEFIDP